MRRQQSTMHAMVGVTNTYYVRSTLYGVVYSKYWYNTIPHSSLASHSVDGREMDFPLQAAPVCAPYTTKLPSKHSHLPLFNCVVSILYPTLTTTRPAATHLSCYRSICLFKFLVSKKPGSDRSLERLVVDSAALVTMTVEVSLNTPLADALSDVVQPKLSEMGWSTGGLDDSALGEYIILMLVNGKSQDQIAAELSNDLLNLEPENSGATDFSRWLFEQVEILNSQLNGSGTSNQSTEATKAQSATSHPESGRLSQKNTKQSDGGGSSDADMAEAMEGIQNGAMWAPLYRNSTFCNYADQFCADQLGPNQCVLVMAEGMGTGD